MVRRFTLEFHISIFLCCLLCRSTPPHLPLTRLHLRTAVARSPWLHCSAYASLALHCSAYASLALHCTAVAWLPAALSRPTHTRVFSRFHMILIVFVVRSIFLLAFPYLGNFALRNLFYSLAYGRYLIYDFYVI